MFVSLYFFLLLDESVLNVKIIGTVIPYLGLNAVAIVYLSGLGYCIRLPWSITTSMTLLFLFYLRNILNETYRLLLFLFTFLLVITQHIRPTNLATTMLPIEVFGNGVRIKVL